MRFEWVVAWRFLREGGIQTALIVVGAALGIAFIVFITGFMVELQRDIVQRTLGVQPHITVKPVEEVARALRQDDGRMLADIQPRGQRLRSIDQWQSVIEQLREQVQNIE